VETGQCLKVVTIIFLHTGLVSFTHWSEMFVREGSSLSTGMMRRSLFRLISSAGRRAHVY